MRGAVMLTIRHSYLHYFRRRLFHYLLRLRLLRHHALFHALRFSSLLRRRFLR